MAGGTIILAGTYDRDRLQNDVMVDRVDAETQGVPTEVPEFFDIVHTCGNREHDLSVVFFTNERSTHLQVVTGNKAQRTSYRVESSKWPLPTATVDRRAR